MGKSIFLVITVAYVEGQVIHQLTVTVTFKISVNIDALVEVLVVPGRRQHIFITTWREDISLRIHALQYSILQIMNHGSRTREDTRKHTEDRPLIAPSFNHMTMIITVLTTMTITHKMANILNSIILSDTVPKNENWRNSGVDSIVHQMGP